MISILLACIFIQLRCRVLEERDDYIKLQLQSVSRTSYTVQMFIGNPPQKQKLLLDTGSDFLILKSENCHTCQQTQLPYFSQTQSTTYHETECNKNPSSLKCLFCNRELSNTSCHLQLKYGIINFTSTKRAVMGDDYLSFRQEESNNSKLLSTIGFLYYESQDNTDSFNGILGLSQSWSFSLMFDWFNANKVAPEFWKQSLCFQGKRGYLEWGNLHEQRVDKTIVKYNFNSAYYSVYPEQISIQQIDLLNKTAMDEHGGISIDSGAGTLVFPSKQYHQIASVIDQICTNKKSSCTIIVDQSITLKLNKGRLLEFCYTLFTINQYFDFNNYLDDIFPQIKVKLNGTYFNIKPSSYFVGSEQSTDSNLKYICLNMMGSIENNLILGSQWMANKKIIFNLQSKDAILEIYDHHQCFNYEQEVLSKMSAGIIGYLMIFFVFMFIFCRVSLCRFAKKQNSFKGVSDTAG